MMEIPEDIKKVLVAVDQLLEALPEEEVDRFINSPEFPIYKRIMNEIYGLQEEEYGNEGDEEESEPSEYREQPTYEPEPVKEAQPVTHQENRSEELKPEPLRLKQPIERLKNPRFSSEKDVQQEPPEEQQGGIVEDVEKGYGKQFEQEQKSREAQELEEFSKFLKSRKPENIKPETEKERQLVDYINKQITNGVREIDIQNRLQKIGWSPEILKRAFNIARGIRIKSGKVQAKKYRVEFM